MAARNKIVINGKEYTDRLIKSGSIFISNSLAFDELSIDTLDTELDCSGYIRTIFRPKGKSGLMTADDLLYTVLPRIRILTGEHTSFTYGTKVEYFREGKLFGVFYISSTARVSKFEYAVSCVSAVGLLDSETHYGGLYSGQKASIVISDIIGGIVPFTVSDTIKNTAVYGWLPIETRRDALRQLLFSIGACIKKDASGKISVEVLGNGIITEIPDSKLMYGGSIEYNGQTNRVVVVEHEYHKTPNDETKTFYDGSVIGETIKTPAGASLMGSLVTFNEPVYGLEITGGSILESGVNYAVVSPGGQVTLTGKKYTHTTREISVGTGNADVSNVARVENATLVNVTNSEVVAKRVYSYYSSNRIVKAGLVIGSERPGDFVKFHDPFDELSTGIIMAQDINISNTLVGDTKFSVGYTPEHEKPYEHSTLITAGGEWTVPSGVKRIRVVLIGGGHGGYPGTRGNRGTSNPAINPDPLESVRAEAEAGEGGDGGEGGGPGSGGNVFIGSMDVSPGQVAAASIGAGGESNSDGGNTTFSIGGTSFSSASGSPIATGYTDIISGGVYALPSKNYGTKGSKGGKGGAAGGTGNRGESHSSGSSGGAGGEGATDSAGSGYAYAYVGGGGGGGAAYGTNGENGGNGMANAFSVPSSGAGGDRYAVDCWSGSGGSGATPAAPPATTVLGGGGDGGHGGGGGGGSGGVEAGGKGSQGSGGGGSGGAGGAGGRGGPGCVIVYW